MSLSLLQLQDLYNESLIREVIKKTQDTSLTWTQSSATVFQTSSTAHSETWSYTITKSQITTLTFQYTLVVRKNSTTYVTIVNGPLPATERESATKDLYEVVELLVLQTDAKVKEALEFTQNI